MENELSLGNISKKFREIIGKKKELYEGIIIDSIQMDYYILAKNKTREKISAVIRNNSDNILSKFSWHIPFITKEMKVCGIECRFFDDILSYNDFIFEDYHLIEIEFKPISKGETIYLEFEYLISYYNKAQKKGILTKTFEYNITFESLGILNVFRINIHLPSGSKYTYDSNIEEFKEFDYNSEKLLVTSEKNFSNGQAFAKFYLKYPSKLYVPILSIIIGLVFSACLAFIQNSQKFLGNYLYIVIGGLLAINIILIRKIFKNL